MKKTHLDRSLLSVDTSNILSLLVWIKLIDRQFSADQNFAPQPSNYAWINSQIDCQNLTSCYVLRIDLPPKLIQFDFFRRKISTSDTIWSQPNSHFHLIVRKVQKEQICLVPFHFFIAVCHCAWVCLVVVIGHNS